MRIPTKRRELVALTAAAIAALLIGVILRPHPAPPGAATLTVAPPPVVDRTRLPAAGRTYAVDVAVYGAKQWPVGFTSPTIALRHSGTLHVSGWALDSQTLLPGRQVVESIDGRSSPVTLYRMSRPDVAQALGIPGAAASGFSDSIAIAKLSVGRHTLQYSVVDEAGRPTLLPTALHISIGS